MKPIPFNRPTILRKDLISVLEHLIDEDISNGESVKKFAKELGRSLKATDRVLLTSSGSTALMMIFQHIGIKAGDEVVLSPLSNDWILALIEYFRAKPIWVDISVETLQTNHENISKKINANTKALIINHHFGYPFFMNHAHNNDWKNSINHYLDKHPQIKIIEDITAGLLTQYHQQYLGTIGDYAFSDFSNHHIIAMDKGGAIITKNKKTTQELLAKSNTTRRISSKIEKSDKVGDNTQNISTESLPIKNESSTSTGSIDFSLSDMQAILGFSKLSMVDKIMVRYKQIKQFYQDSVAKGQHSFLVTGEEIISNHFAFPVILNGDVDTAKKIFSREKIAIRDIVTGTCYQHIPYDESLRNLHRLKNKVILIPIYPTLKKEEIEKISLLINSIK